MEEKNENKKLEKGKKRALEAVRIILIGVIAIGALHYPQFVLNKWTMTVVVGVALVIGLFFSEKAINFIKTNAPIIAVFSIILPVLLFIGEREAERTKKAEQDETIRTALAIDNKANLLLVESILEDGVKPIMLPFFINNYQQGFDFMVRNSTKDCLANYVAASKVTELINSVNTNQQFFERLVYNNQETEYKNIVYSLKRLTETLTMIYNKVIYVGYSFSI